MRRLVLLAALAISACASTPPKPLTPAEQLVAAPWTCESAIGPGTLKTVQTYKSDGTAAFTLDAKGGNGSMTVDASGKGDAKWKLLENDTKMEVTLGNLTVTRANLNGASIDPAMAQAMLGPYLAGQSATTSFAITSTTLELASSDGKTSCTRPEPVAKRR